MDKTVNNPAAAVDNEVDNLGQLLAEARAAWVPGQPMQMLPLTPPAFGTSVELVPGLRWTRIPMPSRLDHINVWALDDGDAGWAVVDTGLCNDQSARVWQMLFDNPPDRRPVSRVFVTHMHPDHIGMAGWLTRKFRARLWTTRGEYLMCRAVVADTGREAPSEGNDFYRRAGWSRASVEAYWVRFGNFGKMIHALPDSYRRICDGEEVRIGAHTWRIVVGRGHSPEHACLYCPELKVLISGDQILPRISSNVSVYPLEPDANPMAEWVEALERIRREVPDDVLVLPAHHECFYGLHARIATLQAEQRQATAALRAFMTEPKRAIDVLPVLFKREIRPDDLMLMTLATGEAIANLNYLIGLGELKSWQDDDGVIWYERV